MNYTEAVRLAKAGEEAGFTCLYQETFKSKYYLALQYMKDEDAAQDILQESFMKAFSKLDTLENPDAFPGWLGMIVANTAKNALAKKNPVLFSDIASDSENEEFEYQIEDDRMEYQPETAYTRQETQQLVRELMDTLSEEQRLCILMFHIEGISIKEIASVLNCSENTVKSRLKYGRDNLKIKAEGLQKKGYKLYGAAPLPLLLYLLRTEGSYLSSGSAFAAVGNQMAKTLFHSPAAASGSSMSAGAKYAAEGGVRAAKTGLIHTMAGKIAVAVIGLCITGGTVFYGVSQMQPKDQTPKTDVAEKQETAEKAPSVKELQDADYAKLIAGSLTKEELEFVLAYGPEEIPEQGFQDSDYGEIINSLCTAWTENGQEPYIEEYGHTGNGSSYSAEDLNRMFLSFTDYQLKEGDNILGDWNVSVSQDAATYGSTSTGAVAGAEITSAAYTEEEMEIYYTHSFINMGMAESGIPEKVVEKKAVLKPDKTGMYRIVNIEEVQETQAEEEESTEQGQTIEEIYAGVKRAAANGEPGYDFPNIETLTGQYGYFLYDLDGDGIKELIIGAEFTDGNGTTNVRACHAYSCEKSGNGYKLKTIGGEVYAETLWLMADGSGIYRQEFSRGTGQIRIYKIMIQNGEFITAETPEYQFTMGDDAQMAFANTNELCQWIDINN